MPVSGLVVTFESDASRHRSTIESLRGIPEIELGAIEGSKLAIVVDSSTKQRDREIWDTVQNLPGVIDLAVAMVGFDEPPEKPYR